MLMHRGIDDTIEKTFLPKRRFESTFPIVTRIRFGECELIVHGENFLDVLSRSLKRPGLELVKAISIIMLDDDFIALQILFDHFSLLLKDLFTNRFEATHYSLLL
jgi:hypothetical protein